MSDQKEKYIEIDVIADNLETIDEIRCSDKSYLPVVFITQNASGKIMIVCKGYEEIYVHPKALLHIRRKLYKYEE